MSRVKLITYCLITSLFIANATPNANAAIEFTLDTILKLQEAEHNFPNKDEFETTVEYNKRVSAYINNNFVPLTSPTYQISDAIIEKSYDADKSIWSFSLFSEKLKAEEIIKVFQIDAPQQINGATINEEQRSYFELKLANTFSTRYSLTMNRDLARTINKSIRAKYTFKIVPVPKSNKAVIKKTPTRFIQIEENNIIFIELVKLQLYIHAMDTELARFSQNKEVIHPIDKQKAKILQSRVIKYREHITSEIIKYKGLIKAVIQSNFVADKYTMKGKKCILTIDLASSGNVKSVHASQGDTVVCNEAKKRILEIAILPVPQEPDIFKEITTIQLTIVPVF